ncbi:MAG: tail fiber protein [Oscillospiraceae bacterium]|nr:tail fiber protein [Oscillospiraceae bacterium]
MALKTYPLDNYDYSAEDAELFHCTRSSGIYANDDFDYSVTGADNTITIGVGLGWIRNSRFSGKVVALTAAQALDMGLPDAVYPRIDAVVIQFDANKNGTEVVVKHGAPASAPVAPEVAKTETLYELHLYHVRREPGAAAVSVSNITDLRMDPNYCGLMADSVTQVDTAAISAQVYALIEDLRQEIQSVKDGSAYLMRSGGDMTGPINMNGQALRGLNAPTADDQAVNLGFVKNMGKAKAGFIYPLAASVVPEGFLLCDGAAYSRTEYPELFAAIGTMYGSGDGSTTFNVPDITFADGVGAIIATGKGTGVSVADIIMGAQALPLGIPYGGTGAGDPKTVRENLEVAQAIKSTEYPGCYYRTVDGETEWLNPPMLPGVEYRTTERWNGKPVYKKRVQYTNSTAISGDALHYIPHGITSYDRLHGVKVTVATEGYLLPYFGASLSQTTAVTGFSATNIELRTTGNSNWSAGRKWNFDVSFVKPD